MAVQHGTYSGYTIGSCRCAACHKAMLRYNKRRVAMIERGEWQPWADAAPVRQRVLSLRDQGWSVESIADVAGVSTCNLYVLLNEDKPRVRATFAEKILSGQFDISRLEPWAKVDSTGTRRRLQALMVLGWSATTLAGRLGMDRSFVRKVMTGPRVRVFAARAVRALFEEISTTRPPETARYERAMATRTRRYAKQRGWVPAMAWDDIDDPEAVPNLGAETPRRYALWENSEELINEQGYTLERAAERLGVAERTLRRARWQVQSEVAS